MQEILKTFIVQVRVASLIIKLNNKYKIKFIQVYATSAYDDENVEILYEDVEANIPSQ